MGIDSLSQNISLSLKPLPPPETNENPHLRLQLLDQCVYKTPFEASSAIFSKVPTLPNEFCSFHWASANFYDDPSSLQVVVRQNILLGRTSFEQQYV